MSKHVKVVITGETGDERDIVKLYANIFEFVQEITVQKSKCERKGKQVAMVFRGGLRETEAPEQEIMQLIRLTHHAEELYEGTGLEYVHVEVCINGRWHGRN